MESVNEEADDVQETGQRGADHLIPTDQETGAGTEEVGRRHGISTTTFYKLYRLYREEGPAVRRRRSRKRATGMRAPLALPQAANQRRSLDFVSDRLAARRFRIWSWSTTSPARAWRRSPTPRSPPARVARELDGLVAGRGRPNTIVSDNWPEFTSRCVLAWTNRAGLD
jgi:putative transposase